MPRTTHVTITPATEPGLTGLSEAMVKAADEVRGEPGVDPGEVLAALGGGALPELDSDTAQGLLAQIGLADGSAGLPEAMAPVMALVEALPREFSGRLLIELMARMVEPRDP